MADAYSGSLTIQLLPINDNKGVDMNTVAKLYPKEAGHYCGPASIIALADREGLFLIRLLEYTESLEISARIAAPFINNLSLGDEVLVTGDVYRDVYVIGLLTTTNKHDRQPASNHLDIGSGSYVKVDTSSGSPALKLFSKRNELLIEYDPESEKARVNIESGDLEFITRSGDIVLNSANNIQIKGKNIDLMGQSGVRFGVLDRIGQLTSSFSLDACQASLNSAKVRVSSQLGEFQCKEARLVAAKFRGTVEDSQLIVDKLSTVANTVTEKAKNVYRTVEELTQLKTGRMRTLVASTFHLKAKKTMMKAQDDFKVNADKIHLG
tara:strand:+ start:1698 stop:2666 length:969 start_codon:yes stop_codon:yes gene_type:complete